MNNRLVFAAILILSNVIFSCSPKKEQSADSAAPTVVAEKPLSETARGLPAITLIGEDGRSFSAEELPGNSILIFFSADCDHCQREATDIQKNLAGFTRYSMCFISMNSFPEMRKFAEKYQIDNQPNIRFLKADGRTVFGAMGSMQTPTICVYNSEKKLVRRFDGETKAEDIIKVL